MKEKNLKVFSNLIREKLTEKKFWQWVGVWKDGGDVCDDAEEWFRDMSIKEQKEEIKELKKLIK
jgi:hypothetical protein